MKFSWRSMSTLALACAIDSTCVTAQQLYQPASVEPWVSPAEQTDIFAYVAKNTPVAPNLQLGTPFKTPAKATGDITAKLLPRVETESFALLGQIRTDKTNHDAVGPTPRSNGRNLSTPGTRSYPPMKFLRANRD